MELIKPDFGLFFWQVIVLLILIFLMSKYAWRPILGSIRKREESINDALASAEKAKLEMSNLKADNEKMLQQAREERDLMLKEAQEMKKNIIAEATEDANIKSSDIISKAKETIEAEKKAALKEIKAQVAELSIDIAEKLVRKELDTDKAQVELVNKMLDDVKAN